jgi:glycopeptide antibiotics resistance protein
MVPRFMYPFLVYRSIVVPFLVVSAIAAPCWLAFRLYRRRISGHRPSLRRELLLVTVVVYLSGIAAATLEPSRPSRAVAEMMVGVQLRPDMASLTCSSATLPVGSTLRAFCVRNAWGNVLLFIPLGILLPLVWRRLRFGRGMLMALGLSCSIELAQYLSRAWGSYRSVDVNDVVLNVAGAFLGLVLVSALRIVPGTRLRSEVPGRVPGL